VLFYCDPPYLHETRTSTDDYAHEMTEVDHRELLEVLLACKGKVLHSGYRSPLYDKALAGRARHDLPVKSNTASSKAKSGRTECLWCNFGLEG
jgi:DNA adenine methylase